MVASRTWTATRARSGGRTRTNRGAATLPRSRPGWARTSSAACRSGSASRLARLGPNLLEAAEQEPAWRKPWPRPLRLLVYLLLGAVAVSLAAWIVEGADEILYEAIVIAAILLLNAGLGYVQERRAEQAVAALQRMAAATAGVVRDGRSCASPPQRSSRATSSYWPRETR